MFKLGDDTHQKDSHLKERPVISESPISLSVVSPPLGVGVDRDKQIGTGMDGKV